MRNIVTIILFFFASVHCFGISHSNTSDTDTIKDVWTCTDFEDALKIYNSVAKQYKAFGNKRWAKELLTAFPISSDNTIKHQYIVKSDSTFDINDIGASLLSWYKTKMTGVNPCPSGSLNHLSGIAILQSVGRAIGYMNATFLNAKEEVTIDIKENRIRITVTILNYVGANTWKGTETIVPGACYPVNSSAGQKDSHAMAFINCHHDAINTVASIIKYLNDNSRTIQSGDDEW